MTGLGIYAMREGDYELILYPLDYQGNLCGTDHGKVDMTEFPYLYYVNDFAGGVCVKVTFVQVQSNWRHSVIILLQLATTCFYDCILTVGMSRHRRKSRPLHTSYLRWPLPTIQPIQCHLQSNIYCGLLQDKQYASLHTSIMLPRSFRPNVGLHQLWRQQGSRICLVCIGYLRGIVALRGEG